MSARITAIGSPFFADEEIAVLGIDTARRMPGKNGRVSLVQMAAVRRVLGPLPDRLFKVLVTHHPLAVPRLAGHLELAGRASRALAAVADAGVHLLLSGHYHRWASGETLAHVVEQALRAGGACRDGGLDADPRRRGQQLQPDPPRRRALGHSVMGWDSDAGFAEVGQARFALGPGGWMADFA